nr:MAG TPA: hypothetical protein [Caudoviricetes sp.]
METSLITKISSRKNEGPALRQALLQVSDILRFAAPRRLRKLNIHVHDILTVMTGEHLAHYYYTQIAPK